MKCYACNNDLNDYEATRKSRVTGEYIDLCDTCFSEVSDVFEDVEDRLDLKQTEEVQIDLEEEVC